MKLIIFITLSLIGLKCHQLTLVSSIVFTNVHSATLCPLSHASEMRAWYTTLKTALITASQNTVDIMHDRDSCSVVLVNY